MPPGDLIPAGAGCPQGGETQEELEPGTSPCWEELWERPAWGLHQDLTALGTGGQLPSRGCHPSIHNSQEGQSSWGQRGDKEGTAEDGVTLLRPAELSRRAGDLGKSPGFLRERQFPRAPPLSRAEIRAVRVRE